jgi:tetratricopeptide (TPR) repeat protein
MDARVLSRLSEASEGQAQMNDQEFVSARPENRDPLMRERDELWGRSEEALRRAQAILTAGRVTAADPNYRMVMIDLGNIPFGRAAWAASVQEKVAYYQQAVLLYQRAAALLPDDPRPVFYEGLCYERLTELAQSPEEKKVRFSLGQAALKKASTMMLDTPDYNPALPYRGMASLHAHMSDFQAALAALKQAKQLDTTQSPDVDRDIQSIEAYLAAQGKKQD